MARGSVYASEYVPDFGIPWPKVDVALMDDKALREHAVARMRVEEAAKLDPVQFGWTLESWRDVMKEWGNYNKLTILGGNRCVRGDTMIYDPVAKISRRVDSIKKPFHVLAWNGREQVVAEASTPFTKPAGEMVRVVLKGENWVSFVAALEHRVLGATGAWISCAQLQVGSKLFLAGSSSEPSPLGQNEGGRHWSGTPSGSQDGYLTVGRLCDEQPLAVGDNVPDASPSPGGAPRRIFSFGSIFRLLGGAVFRYLQCRSDDLDSRFGYNLEASWSCRPSTPYGHHRPLARFSDIELRASCTPCRSALGRFWDLVRGARRTPLAGSDRQFQSNGGFVPPDSLSCYGKPYVVQSITSEGIDVKWDISVPSHENYIVDGVVHHNSSKTTFAARLCLDAAMKIPEAKIRCYHVNEEKSVTEQQALIWDYLPARYKEMGKKKGVNFSIQYSQKNGFTGSKLILPPMEGYSRGSEIQFSFYQQYRNDAQVAEGWSAHLIWCDEECPQKLFETLQYRIVDLDGRIVMTFTTLNGWTPLVADICSRKKVLSKRYSSLLKKEIPYAEESLSRSGMRLCYFWTEDNPFIPTKQFLKDLSSRPDDEKLARAHGIPTKAAMSKFPKFDESVHVIDKMPWQDGDTEERKQYSRFMVVDPAGNKPWFMIWAAIDVTNKIFIYREWPDQSFGNWSEPGETPEGKAGAAQKPLGYGINDYVQVLKDVEGDDEITERLIDPRLSAAKTPGKDGATTLLTELEDSGLTFIPAPGIDIEDGIALINDRLGYDTTKPIGATNSPKLFISSSCLNLIDSMRNYSGYNREEVWKDPIDCVRYLLVSGACHADSSGTVDTGKTFSY